MRLADHLIEPIHVDFVGEFVEILFNPALQIPVITGVESHTSRITGTECHFINFKKCLSVGVNSRMIRMHFPVHLPDVLLTTWTIVDPSPKPA